MPPDSDSHLDALALVIGAVRDSAKLQLRFQELARMSDEARRSAILRAIQEMRQHREPGDLVAAFGLLAHPQIFTAAASALRELGIPI